MLPDFRSVGDGSAPDNADNSCTMTNETMTPSAEDVSTLVINTAVDQADTKGGVSYGILAQNIEATAKDIGVETPDVTKYVDALRSFSHDAAVGPLPDGIGGLYDGSITIATNTVEVGSGGVDQTIAQMQEVYDHELYHALNGHTDAMMTWDGAPTVVIAGEGFDTTEVIEGLTVTETGEEFVSDGYKQHKSDLLSAISAADLSLDDVRNAVNTEKDFGLIDDRKRDPANMVALVT